MLVNTRLVVREPRRQGAGDMVDDLVRLGARAWAPPLPILGRGGDGTVSEKRGLHVVGKTRQGLSGIRFTGKGRAAQRLEGFDSSALCLSHCLSTARWACGWRGSEWMSTQRCSTPPELAGTTRER